MIIYNGIQYPIRDLFIYTDNETKKDDEPTNITIAQLSLLQLMIKNNPTLYGGTEEWIDNQIYFYLEDNLWELSDQEVALKHLDKVFEIANEY